MNCLAIVLLVLCWMYTCPVAVDITNVDDHDPGSCDQSNALQVYSVNDRNDKKKLWICSKENGKYLWKPVDGEAHLGEFLYPGHDCSNILDEEQDADDGFYWITLGTATKRKVWCDMTTDGGGYMLIARKHDAITWDVPSKDKPVEPNSLEKYWTSQLGDAPILDFRIQLSTSDSLDAAKAHWSYRMNNTRKLENLMIKDRGCTRLSPGIGDIAYVKDLLAEKIVSTTFQCSVFGDAKSDTPYKTGWPMMNECLKRPCEGSGYLHVSGHVLPLDHTGVFSFSTESKLSGIDHDATAYIGCSSNKCCGCFGPVGEAGTFCDTQCNAINGGTYVDPKNLYTWVWVRSNLPKRIWNRCMEYQSEDEQGQLRWYNMVGDSVIAEKGRCHDQGELRLNSGVVVVPDHATAEKVPEIPGLLEYRKDQKKLYLRANKTWSLLTQEKEVKGKLIQLEEILDARFKQLNATNADLRKKIEATDVNLEGKIASVEAADTALQGKIDTKYTELQAKIDSGQEELKNNLSFAIPNYNDIVKDGMKMTFRECIEYKWLTGSTRHYSYYNPYGNTRCDSHLSGWYRFGGGAGTQMYTGCRSSHNYCGASNPGYMSGGHPSVSDGKVSRTVYFYSSSYGCTPSNQYYRKTIQVINCAGLYYVYELNGTPYGYCNHRYCSQ